MYYLNLLYQYLYDPIRYLLNIDDSIGIMDVYTGNIEQTEPHNKVECKQYNNIDLNYLNKSPKYLFNNLDYSKLSNLEKYMQTKL